MKKLRYGDTNGFEELFHYEGGTIKHKDGVVIYETYRGMEWNSEEKYYEIESLEEFESIFFCDYRKNNGSSKDEIYTYKIVYSKMKNRLIKENIEKYNSLINSVSYLEKKLIDLDCDFKVENYNVCDSNKSIGINQIDRKISYYETILRAKTLSDGCDSSSICFKSVSDYDYEISKVYLEYLKLLKEFKKSVDFLKKYSPAFDFSSYFDRLKDKKNFTQQIYPEELKSSIDILKNYYPDYDFSSYVEGFNNNTSQKNMASLEKKTHPIQQVFSDELKNIMKDDTYSFDKLKECFSIYNSSKYDDSYKCESYMYDNGYVFKCYRYDYNSKPTEYYLVNDLDDFQEAYNQQFHFGKDAKVIFNEVYGKMKERLIKENIDKFNILVDKIDLLEEDLREKDNNFSSLNYNVYDNQNLVFDDVIAYYNNILNAKKISDKVPEATLYFYLTCDFNSKMCEEYLEYLKFLKNLKDTIAFLKKYVPDFDFSSYTDRFKKEDSYQKIK